MVLDWVIFRLDYLGLVMKIQLNDISCRPDNLDLSVLVLYKYMQSISNGGDITPPLLVENTDLIRELFQIKDTEPEKYLILDGHHRVMSYRRMGYTEFDCNVVDLTVREK